LQIGPAGHRRTPVACKSGCTRAVAEFARNELKLCKN
jgi:hypothetical protein